MIYDGCTGCEYEDKSEDSKECSGCKNTFRIGHTGNAVNKYTYKTLTERNAQGNWNVKGLPWEKVDVGQTITREMYEKLYGCLFKLMQYESTGLTPEQVEQLMEDK